MLHVWFLDPCCGTYLTEASNAGDLDKGNEWKCPECGCRWAAEVVGEMKHWSAQPDVAIF